jgi:hypothetical protein
MGPWAQGLGAFDFVGEYSDAIFEWRKPLFSARRESPTCRRGSAL